MYNPTHGEVAALERKVLTLMRQITLWSAILASVLVLMAGCTNASSSQEHKGSTQEKASTQEHKAYTPHINPAQFTTKIDNEYFPMKPGTTFVYEGKGERDEMRVTHSTKMVMGVECVVVDDRAWEEGKLRMVLRGGHKGVQKRQGGEHKGLVGGRGRRSQAGDHHAGRAQGRSVLPPGVLSWRGRRHGESTELERIGDGALRILRSRARDQGMDAAPTCFLREEVLRSRGWSFG